MKITSESMRSYMTQLSNINEKAKQEALKYIQDNNYDIDDGFIEFAHGLTTKYGEAAAELSCRMYDELHQYWKEAKKSTKSLLPAEPAEVPTRSDVEKAVYGTLKTSVNEIPGVVSRLVKQTAEDTKIKNGMRDGAEFAWIPAGDSCAFCLVLASRGWQRISKKTLKNGHAEHIHANCDCTYTVRFDSTTEVEGYDPELYRRMWDDADGKNAKTKLRSLRKEVREDEFLGKYGLADTTSALDVVDTVKAINKNGKQIVFSDKMDEKWQTQKDIITELSNQYNTNVESVSLGAKEAAGHVDISGSQMRLSSKDTGVVLHEFAHTLSTENAMKLGLNNDSEFWKEIGKIMRKYHKDVDADGDTSRWISSYEHSLRDKSEFMAEAFTHVMLRDMGIPHKKYGSDYTYSQQVMDVIDKYFRKS